MLKASEAREISNGYSSDAVNFMKERLENAIMRAAKEGVYWLSYDYDADISKQGVTKKDICQICNILRSAGYDVKDDVFAQKLTVRW